MAHFFGNPLALGQNLGSGQNLVWMSAAERARHFYIVGATRTGKSKQLEDCVRQDILAWPRSGCGLMVLDRHGSLYDNVIAEAAAQDLSNWPIVPIDLRRNDWIVSYNPLRRRSGGEEPAVVVGNFVRSILHACGQSSLDETPRLAKWLDSTLLTLHHHGFTLAEALQLISSPDVRHAMTSQVEDTMLKYIWQTAPTREADFQEVVESTVNRIRRFLSRTVMRAALGQNDVSLDLGTVLEEGQILLVTTATEGAKIDDEDASLFGSLLLSDLWLAAKARGKREEGQIRPFYVYLDEFQEYLTPAMAETLDQASGFGLHMMLSHQFPSQLLHSEQGRRIYNSIMANCRNKAVFQLDHNEDVEALALMLFRQEVDSYKVKNEIWSTKVLSYDLQYLDSYTDGVNSNVGGGTSISVTEGESRSVGTNWSHTEGRNSSISESAGLSLSESEGRSTSQTDLRGHSNGNSSSQGTSEGTSELQSTNWAKSMGTSRSLGRDTTRSWGGTNTGSSGGMTSASASNSLTHKFGHPSEKFQGNLKEYSDGEMLDEEEEDRFKRRASGVSLSEGESETTGQAWTNSSSTSRGGSRGKTATDGTSRAITRGGGASTGQSMSRSVEQGRSEGFNSSEARAEGRSRGSALSCNREQSVSFGLSESDTVGGSETFGRSIALTEGENSNWSEGESQSVTSAPILIPRMGRELSSITYESIEEQLFRFAQFLAGQKDRQCVVKLVSKPPVSIMTLTVKTALTMPEWTHEWVTCMVQGLGYALPLQVALARINERQTGMLATLLKMSSVGEPVSFGRPVASPPLHLGAQGVPMVNRGRKPRS